jgi:hypothetical protein
VRNLVNTELSSFFNDESGTWARDGTGVGWIDIGTRTKVPLRFVTYLSKVTKINEKSVLTQ